MTKEIREYTQLKKVSKEIQIFVGIHHLLDWDQETYMPPDAAGIRSEQLEALAGLIHQKKTSAAFLNALKKLVDLRTGKPKISGLSKQQQAALREWRRDYLIEKALPKRFVEAFAKLTSQAMHAWKHAKEQDAFLQFAPFLEKIIQMVKKKAEYLGYEKHPYDALLDLYEPGVTVKQLVPLFGDLQQSLKKLIQQASKHKKVDDRFLFGSFDQDTQIAFGKQLLEAMHYDLSKGRLDLSAHPFSSSAHPTDSRVTTRIHPTSLMSSIFAVLHEGGHGLYEMGLPVEQYGTPLGEAISMGMHESQSRWWETFIGRSKPFWTHFLPKLKEAFPSSLHGISLDKFMAGINLVRPGFIRIESDDATYNLHIILRFELEKALIEGQLKVRDIPEAWNEKMKALLGIVPANNREGCLQDIHWSMGAFGYFPSYTIGNLYAAQLFAAFMKEHKDWEKRVAKGELLFIKDWLNKNVHQHGRQYTSNELLTKLTGKGLSAEPLISHLNKRYG